MKKLFILILALLVVLSLAACGGMSAEEKETVEQELIAVLGGESYYCRNHPMKSGKQGGTLEEDIICVTFSEDCSTADVVWSYQITPFHNGTAQNRNTEPHV